ncbi:MAG: hypothetical protein CMA82_00255 [Euryarchaeota archaeon]|nr:hypothetical protein [Euryarchaeota archaeon]
MSAPSSPSPTDDLESLYRSQIRSMMTEESQKRIDMHVDPKEDKRLMDLDIIELVSSSSADTVPALMARLGVVRAALIGHGGALVLHSHSINKDQAGVESLSLVIDLDGACVSCGAAPGTLKGIQDDLLADPKISRVRFNKGMLDWFTEIQREFVLEHGGVTFA